MTKPEKTPAKRISQLILFLAALAFFTYYGFRNWNEVTAVIGEFDAGLLFAAALFVTASLFCKALMNLYLIRALLHTPLDGLTLLHSYTQSQIVKYIPGKIWGIVFQASSLQDNIRKSDVWIVSALQMIIMNAFSLLILIATIAFIDTLSVTIRAILVIGGVGGFAFVYFNSGRVLRFAKLDTETLKKYAALIDTNLTLRLSLVLIFDWIFYLGMWAALAYGSLSFFAIFVTAVNYTTASIVGWLVFFLPSGLVVREAAFIAFGQIIGENISLLVVYSVVARLLFLAGDLVLYLITVISKSVYERSKGTLGADS